MRARGPTCRQRGVGSRSMATHDEAAGKTGGIESNFVARPASSSLRLSGLSAHKVSVRRFARENGCKKSLTGAQAHSWRGFQGCRTSFAAVKNRDRPFQRWEHGGAAHVVLRHAGRSGVKAARQLPAHCRDELKYSPPAVRVRTQPGLRVEKYRGEDENREERARHEATKRGSRFAEPGSQKKPGRAPPSCLHITRDNAERGLAWLDST